MFKESEVHLSAISAVEPLRFQASQEIARLKETTGTEFILGILGGSTIENPDFHKHILNGLLMSLENKNIAVLTGGTQGGIPEYACTIASEHNIPTIGVLPESCQKYALKSGLDLEIQCPPPLVGDSWFGSETPTLIQIPDFFVVIGGSNGTAVEVFSILKVNERRIKKGEPIKYICPINGSGGIADFLRYLKQGNAAAKISIPEIDINTGKEAADYILNIARELKTKTLNKVA